MVCFLPVFPCSRAIYRQCSGYTATNFNLDGGSSGGQTDDTDHFVSFVIPFNELVTAVNSLELEGIDNFDENSVIRYVTATAQQRNALNQDLHGVEGSTGSSSTWEELGGFTPEVYASGQPIPEPTSALLLGAGCMLLFSRGRRRAHAGSHNSQTCKRSAARDAVERADPFACSTTSARGCHSENYSWNAYK